MSGLFHGTVLALLVTALSIFKTQATNSYPIVLVGGFLLGVVMNYRVSDIGVAFKEISRMTSRLEGTRSIQLQSVPFQVTGIALASCTLLSKVDWSTTARITRRLITIFAMDAIIRDFTQSGARSTQTVRSIRSTSWGTVWVARQHEC